jgi:5'-nucleotidase
MTNDAKLGLAIGISLVIVVGILYYRKDAAGPSAVGAGKSPANVGASPGPVSPPPRRSLQPATAGRTTSHQEEASPTLAVSPRRHTVEAGETLFSLARRYYGDPARFVDLYHHNRNVLDNPDLLEVGTVLVIPDATNLSTDSADRDGP